MKLFDFSNGKKGEYLCDVKKPNWFGGGLVDDGLVISGRYTYHSDAGVDIYSGAGEQYNYSLLDIIEKLGVDAVCYCEGQFFAGEGDGVWEWGFTAKNSEIAVKLAKKTD